MNTKQHSDVFCNLVLTDAQRYGLFHTFKKQLRTLINGQGFLPKKNSIKHRLGKLPDKTQIFIPLHPGTTAIYKFSRQSQKYYLQRRQLAWSRFNCCALYSYPYRMLPSLRIVSRSFTTLSKDGLCSGSWCQHFSISSQHLCGNTSSRSGVLLSSAFNMSMTRGRIWRLTFWGWLPFPSHTLHKSIPNAYTSMVLSYCCLIISGAMLIGVPTSELLARPSGLQRPRSVSLALLFSSNWGNKRGITSSKIMTIA